MRSLGMAGVLVLAVGAPSAAAQLEPLFPVPVWPTSGSGGASDRAADLDLDGRLDLVLLQTVADGAAVSVMLALPGGGYTPCTDHALLHAASDVAVGPLEADPFPDVVACMPQGARVAVFRGTGGGALLPAVQYFVGGKLRCVAVGDVNEDGLADIVTGTDGLPAALQVNLADGTSGFLATMVQTIPLRAWRLELADVDDDGHLDAVIATQALLSGTDAISVAHGDGTGGFVAPVAQDVGAHPWSLLVRDLDLDGHLDVAAGCSSLDGTPGVVALLHGDGAGLLQPPVLLSLPVDSTDVDAADFDGNGSLDLLVGGSGSQVALLPGDGAGGYLPAEVVDGSNAIAAVLATDATDDGMLDAVTWSPTPRGVGVLVGDGAGGFVPAERVPVELPGSLAVADLDGDGLPDLLTANNDSGTVTVLHADGAGGFGPPDVTAVYPAVSKPADARAGDLDGDGDPDVVVVGGSSLATVRNDGGVLAAAVAVPGSVGGYDGELADLDGDGDLDALAVGLVPPFVAPYPSRLVRYLGDGAGLLLSPAQFPSGDFTIKLDAGDLDGDGRPDAVTANSFGGDVTVLLNDGKGGFRTGSSVATAPDCYDVALGDLDLDGLLDAATAHFDGTVTQLHGEGGGALALQAVFPGAVGLSGSAIDVADLDGDGWPDVVESRYQNNSFGVRLNDGTGGLLPPLGHAAGPFTGAILVADIDGDQEPDVLVANAASFHTLGSISLARNQSGSLTWTDLGEGLVGALGMPQLVGTGALLPGTPGDLRLFHARPASLAALFISASSAPAPFKGGTLVPVPPAATLLVVTDFAGALTLGWSAWPSNVPGEDWYFQYAIADPEAVHGVALSNALRAVEP